MALSKVLWVDDEIEILEAHKLFLEMKGYEIIAMTNGFDAMHYLQTHVVDCILLDESMPGMSGLETLQRIKRIHPHLPVVLVTKNETESLMEEAIGSQISDYLIKPVHPNQVLLSLKKILDNKRLIAEKITSSFQQQFRNMFDALYNDPDFNSWIDIYRQLVYWEMEIEKSETDEMMEVLLQQKKEANAGFFKFIAKRYAYWINQLDEQIPVLSHHFFQKKVLPYVQRGETCIWLLIDNFRLDQWKAIEPMVSELFRIQEDDCYYSILPTATHYCRNALFAGMLPAEIEKKFPALWKRDDDEDGKNNHEVDFLQAQLSTVQRRDLKFTYQKILSHQEAQRLAENGLDLLSFELSVVVYNFVDMMSHARTGMDVLKELAADEKAYRSLTKTWFIHSPLYQLLKKLSDKKCTIVLSTDHGSLQVKNPLKVIADKQTTTNLRYKNGKNLDVDLREVISFKDPLSAGLPRSTINSSYIFAGKQDYLCYPTNFNRFANMYKNSFQHGGVSMEEMIIPAVRLTNK